MVDVFSSLSLGRTDQNESVCHSVSLLHLTETQEDQASFSMGETQNAHTTIGGGGGVIDLFSQGHSDLLNSDENFTDQNLLEILSPQASFVIYGRLGKKHATM